MNPLGLRVSTTVVAVAELVAARPIRPQHDSTTVEIQTASPPSFQSRGKQSGGKRRRAVCGPAQTTLELRNPDKWERWFAYTNKQPSPFCNSDDLSGKRNSILISLHTEDWIAPEFKEQKAFEPRGAARPLAPSDVKLPPTAEREVTNRFSLSVQINYFSLVEITSLENPQL
ncbi:hypothetical protein EVAR_88769_1 [Eumeta japonica]|uniref:Uncharacterized protein n=1 Tax=Eumeta variegata TaxID=151549 RepID=A0A4C1XWB8_EUMVA|nr:hypothetical protein EVAR_88769_1 [Eumeta japonica]